MLSILPLCLVTDYHAHFSTDYDSFLRDVINGGVSCVQFRDKNSSYPQLLDRALAIQAILEPHNIPFIINDNIQLAAEINADGVHLGQNDVTPKLARELLGVDKIIGYSIETDKQLTDANQMDCLTYVAASAVFPSHTKKDCRTIWGCDGLAKLTRQSRYPVIAIGGINADNIASVMKSGADGVAVVSALHQSKQPKQAAQQLRENIHTGRVSAVTHKTITR